MPQLQVWTPDMVRALPDDGKRYECVDGELLVTPAPTTRHQLVALRLASRLFDYGEGVPSIHVSIAPHDVEFAHVDLVQPDVLVVGKDEARRAVRSPLTSLLLAVEILSPSSARADRQVKRMAYQRHGVPLYWMVDHEGAVVEAWTPGDTTPRQIRDTLHWQPDGAHAPFTLALDWLFRPI